MCPDLSGCMNHRQTSSSSDQREAKQSLIFYLQAHYIKRYLKIYLLGLILTLGTDSYSISDDLIKRGTSQSKGVAGET